ncbi:MULTISPECIES: NAD(P) transhydrogenase subunit alpha [Subtercola]|uniref:proton-translocating NAD(P)(+) transhydrogenase n=1 Tax=Subtercola vilae TaxID=2056433 RepID=A0A4T2C9L6_9MICO|nr:MULTISPECIES: NAD(P) transhydrogenase subunit alpha [Subtercola]MEA9983811.1 NAD(P) transhydrogenase subunit alpha [Subtercola sp. RTI3]TIH40649.1 NAD(P) transhydrogenase subunit alpha [Subtercola vilae]
MTETLFSNLAIFVLSLLVGFEVISKIPSTLHTPMMSGANAIHGVVIAGAVAVAAAADTPAGYILTFIAALFASANVFGGYVVTDRMLRMFTPAAARPSTPVAATTPATTMSGKTS